MRAQTRHARRELQREDMRNMMDAVHINNNSRARRARARSEVFLPNRRRATNAPNPPGHQQRRPLPAQHCLLRPKNLHRLAGRDINLATLAWLNDVGTQRGHPRQPRHVHNQTAEGHRNGPRADASIAVQGPDSEPVGLQPRVHPALERRIGVQREVNSRSASNDSAPVTDAEAPAPSTGL